MVVAVPYQCNNSSAACLGKNQDIDVWQRNLCLDPSCH